MGNLSLIHRALAALCALLPLVAGGAQAATDQGSAQDACTIGTQPSGRLGLPRAQADWAWVCRYRTENERLVTAGQRPEGVFIGDSITERWPGEDSTLFRHGRVSRGIGGQTSAQVLLRFQQDAIALKPRYIHLLVGTNDIAGNEGAFDQTSFRNNIRMMVGLAKQHRIRLLIGSLPPADRFYWREQFGVALKIKVENAWLADYAKHERLVFIDYYTKLATDSGALRPDFTSDGVHPNRAGYAAMRRVAASYIPDLR